MSTELRTAQLLPVMEHFLTIQGEGAHTGRLAYFIRLAGCEIGCHWCDVKESWSSEGYPKMEPGTLASEAARSSAACVVVTGGEPLSYNLDVLSEALREQHLRTHLETSGAYTLSGHWDWICWSPKKQQQSSQSVAELASELKIVVYNRDDLRFAEEQSARVSDRCQLFLQPEWGKRTEIVPLIMDFLKKKDRWRLSLQSHKYIDLP